MIQILVFCLVSCAVFWKAYIGFARIYTNIRLGEDEITEGNVKERFGRMILFALGQKKMFERPIAGIFHFFIYVAFLFTQIEFIEILCDGISGNHRMFASSLGNIYNVLINFIEFLSILAFIGTIIFLSRRHILKLLRFQKPELKGWPSKDANIILLGEMVLIIAIFMMNGSDHWLQLQQPDHYPSTGKLLLSSMIGAPLNHLSVDSLIIIERIGWWLHLAVIYGFMLYLPQSKHLHIFLAFPNSYFSNLGERGKMNSIPEIENEVRGMMGLNTIDISNPKESFGVRDVRDLSWKVLLEAYSCTECGRCTSVCPANITGKKLSPRKIIMDIRDRTDELGLFIQNNKNSETQDDGRSLFDYISKEELYACTSCNACVEACPVLINPLRPILEMRRYDILMNSGGPSEWLPMFNSLENAQSVWQMPSSREAWTSQI